MFIISSTLHYFWYVNDSFIFPNYTLFIYNIYSVLYLLKRVSAQSRKDSKVHYLRTNNIRDSRVNFNKILESVVYYLRHNGFVSVINCYSCNFA